MSELTVDIVTPEKVVFSGPAREVRAPGIGGEFGILPGHTIFLSLLRPGVAVIDGPTGSKSFLVGKGFAEAGPDKVVLLAEVAEPVSAIDRDAAEAARKDADAALEKLKPDSPEAALARDALALAQARLDA